MSPIGTFRTSQRVRRMSAVEGITDAWWIHPRGNVAVFAQFISARYSILISQFYCLLVGQS